MVPTLLSLCANLVLAFLLFLPLERLFAARRQKMLRTAFWTDLGYYFLNGIVPKMLLQAPLMLAAALAHRALPSAYYAWCASLPMAVRVLAGLAIGDFGYYWAHRWMHEVPFLWRFHAIHHSAEDMDFLVNTRAHPGDIVFGRLIGSVPLYLLGIAQPSGAAPDLVPQLVAVLGGFWGFFVHANVTWRFGALEHVLATPAFHHWHHTNDAPELTGKNYSAILPLYDRLFGSLHLPKTLPQSYGIAETMPGHIADQLLYPVAPPPEAAARGA